MVLPSSATLRTAVDLKKAIDSAADRLRPIGFCPTVSDKWREDNHVEIDDDEEKDEQNARAYNALMEELSDIKEELNSPSYIGTLVSPFSLTITRENCEFTGEIVPTKSAAHKVLDKAAQKTAEEATAALLKKWFDGGAVSGYGDMLAQETKVDPSVRNAREIPAAEFTELLESVRKHWAAHFFPTLVHVEPYKIHLYGPGGKFKEHRDTPETDLVGTFLVGLGDTTGPLSGELLVKGLNAWHSTPANPGAWVAFYPDVKHKVTEVKQGYRAVIAFKIFRLPEVEENPMESVAHAKIKAVLDRMPTTYGLLLQHQYCKGTTQLSGFDAHMFSAAKARADVETHILPVLTKFDATKWYIDDGDGDSCQANVFPLMEPHVDALVKSLADSASDSSSEEDWWLGGMMKKKPLELSLKGTEAAWIEERNVSKVPFYSPDFWNSLVIWRQIIEDSADFTGNEARPATDDSIYLSYAMVVLPKESGKRKREVDEGE